MERRRPRRRGVRKQPSHHRTTKHRDTRGGLTASDGEDGIPHTNAHESGRIGFSLQPFSLQASLAVAASVSEWIFHLTPFVCIRGQKAFSLLATKRHEDP